MFKMCMSHSVHCILTHITVISSEKIKFNEYNLIISRVIGLKHVQQVFVNYGTSRLLADL